MSGTGSALFILGALFTFFGICSIGVPDLVPYGEQFSRWMRRLPLIRRLHFMRLSRTVYADTGAGAIALGGSGSAIVSVGAGASSEEKIEFLLRRDQEAQQKINELAQRLTAIEKEMETEIPKALAALRSEMEKHVEHEISAALERYRPLRAFGAGLLFVGLALTTSAVFVV